MDTFRATRRRLSTVCLAAAAGLAALTGCGGDAPPAAPPGSTVEQIDAQLPVDTSLVPVAVTRPATVGTVAPGALPERARVASRFRALDADEQVCVEATIAAYVDQDPTVAEVNGRLGGLMGGAIVACMDRDRMGTTFADALASAPLGATPLDEAQKSCLAGELSRDPDGAARLIGSLLVSDLDALLEAFEPLESACGFQVGP